MKQFEIIVRETRTAIYIVEADSVDEAQELDLGEEIGAKDYDSRTVSVTEVPRYE
jgi:hypothetical protein